MITFPIHVGFIMNYSAAAVIAVYGMFFAINRMSKCTEQWIRLSWITMTVGAIAILAGPFYGYTLPVWQEVILNIGTAIYIVRDRRCIFRCPNKKASECPLKQLPKSPEQ